MLNIYSSLITLILATDIKIGDKDSDIIDHALLASPSIHTLTHQIRNSAINVSLLIEFLVNDRGHDFMVGKPVPESV